MRLPPPPLFLLLRCLLLLLPQPPTRRLPLTSPSRRLLFYAENPTWALPPAVFLRQTVACVRGGWGSTSIRLSSCLIWRGYGWVAFSRCFGVCFCLMTSPLAMYPSQRKRRSFPDRLIHRHGSLSASISHPKAFGCHTYAASINPKRTGGLRHQKRSTSASAFIPCISRFLKLKGYRNTMLS